MRHQDTWHTTLLRSYGLFVILVALLAGVGFGQIDQGTISGNIQDPSGAVIANAKITAKGVLTGTVYETVSSSAGAYRIPIKARKASAHDPDVLFEFGMVALQMSLFPDAIEAFQQALAVRKDDPNMLYGLGRAQVGLLKYQDAKESFERYVHLHPDDASGHYGLGLVLAALQQSPDAQKEFERSIELQPVQTEAYFQLGLIDLEGARLDEAASRFQRVLQRDPKHAGALVGMGRIEFQRKQYQNAADLLQRAVTADSSLRQAHYYLGLTYARLGEKENSEKELQTASQIERDDLDKSKYVLKLLNPEEAPPGTEKKE